MTDAVSSSTASAGAAADGALGKARLADNFDTFLALLTTQLRNQDPLSPLDSNQFTQQLVQMSGVEQQLRSNDLLSQLVTNTSSGVSTAVALIGKNVRAVTDTAALKDGQANWVYKLDTAAADVKLEVVDANGKVVHAEAATDNKAGDHAFTWNGKDLTGADLPDGQYTLRVSAKGPDGSDVASTTYVDGVVSGVEQTSSGTMIVINGAKVAWDHVTTITQPAEPPAQAAS